ncbi:MAG TPA: DJ-1/PfpI family protein [Nitrososphaeraceae archaeon]|nr:DJ-1/PfpI family protein [Nitrososphaeraceae archaeon]
MKNDNQTQLLPLTVGILIFDQVEVLDVAGPFEVFAVARLNEERRQDESSPFKIFLISEKPGPVLAIGGLRFTPDVTIDNCPEGLDILIIPGGWGTRNEVKNVNLLKWIANRASKTKLTASVCTGSSLLGKSGLLDGREATTHWGAFDFLRQAAPNAYIRKDVRFTLVDPIFSHLHLCRHFCWNRHGPAHCQPLFWNQDRTGHCTSNGISISLPK